nr:hypothetical protein [uncultured Ruegeria sp.]
MKPAFALSFSADGISLHHHSDDDWFCIGTVPLDAPDFPDRMQALRDAGFALENDLSCKVVIPEDQIRFLTVEAEGPDADDTGQKVRDALTGATPYALDELAYDTATDGQQTRVAAVATQTLDEAREFATQHGFIPIVFSADTGPNPFPTEPIFLPRETTELPAAPEPADTAQEPEEEAESNTPVHAIAATDAPIAFRAQTAPGAEIGTGAADLGEAKLYKALALVAGVLAFAIGLWFLTGSEDEISPEPVLAQSVPDETASPSVPDQVLLEKAPEPEGDIAEIAVTPPPVEETSEPVTKRTEIPISPPVVEEKAEPTATDLAILEALDVIPTPVEQVARDPQAQQELQSQTGVVLTAPEALIPPPAVQSDDLYLSSLDPSNLSHDAVALPAAEKFDTDQPFEQPAAPSGAGTRFVLDERGLVTPTADGTLNPDGVMVFLGRPSSVPPEVPVRFEQEPIVEEGNDRLAGLRPKVRPGNLIEGFERQQLGGRTRDELSGLRPKLRPKSLQEQPQIDETPTALAVVRVPRPKSRPAGLAAASAPKANTTSANLGSTAAIDQSSDDVGSFAAKSVAPKIPSRASVARQATLDNAINLRKLNLIGVYGSPANRRALIRLPSGRYKKLKVGDRLDGGRVIAIGDSQLQYQKKGRNVTLKMPRS